MKSAGSPYRYWRSLDELADTPEFRRFVEAEFPGLWDRFSAGPGGEGATRRQFLKLMGASFALAGLVGCRWPKETIVPATRQPGNRIPGVPVQYATALELAGVATGLLVTSYDGRPVKVEGNEKHPFSRGKTSAWMQASLLELYDPDRSQRPVRAAAGATGGGASVGAEASVAGRRQNVAWPEFEAFARPHFAALREQGGARLAILSEASSSPSLTDMKARLLNTFPQAAWYEYEPLSRDNEREGARLAFGRPHRTHLHLDRSDVILSLDSDFLMLHPAALKYAADFAARRRADDGTMNRLYVLESNFTVTGSMADHRYALRPSQIGRALEQISAAVRSEPPMPDGPLAADAAVRLAADLLVHRGRCVVVVGPGQPPQVHAAAHALNAELGACGQTMSFTNEPDAERPAHAEAIAKLADALRSGAVDTLVILGGNPVYNAPADLAFGAALSKVATSIHLGCFDDETGRACTWHLPRAHYLESWGDALAWDGTLSIVQPLIEPLYGGRSPIELLALLCDDPRTGGHDIVRRTFGNAFDFGVDRRKLWEQSLHDGVVADTAWPSRSPEARPVTPSSAQPARPAGEFEVVLVPDYKVLDGRFANNAWLQELPDPITKLTWDNAALLAPADAGRLGVKTYGEIVRIEHAGQSIEVPAYILPGHAEGTVTLPLGYGGLAGKIAEGAGFDAFKLRTQDALHVVPGARIIATGARHALATTQDHHAIRSAIGDKETQRRIGVLVREATLEEYRHEPDFAHHVVHLPQLQSLWQEKEYTGHKWGMAIDLSACIGCGACVVACQAENNIPVVGKDEVARGREMHWIRVDRYFREGVKGSRGQGVKGSGGQGAKGDDVPPLEPSDPRPLGPFVEVVHQPVTCVHCENAPCEQVCPVAATVHDEEGLNVMVYNRCIGTRYCSNNCPFKVRRFNWFYNHHGPYHPRSRKGDARPLPGQLKRQDLTEIEKLANNPSVTVRSRGVMEKCTFCVQRINAVKIAAQNERWPALPDGSITPACAQACPADAIVFGDLNDPNSRVRKLHEHNRAYELLAELNIKTRTRYLAKLRNPKETQA